MNKWIANAIFTYTEEKKDLDNVDNFLELLDNLGKTRAVKTVIGGLLSWCETVVKKAFAKK